MIPAAVLVPIIQHASGPTVLFTVRSDLVKHHKNEISFPGGTIDEGDLNAEHTALRETEEEIGVPRDKIDIIQSLPALSLYYSLLY